MGFFVTHSRSLGFFLFLLWFIWYLIKNNDNLWINDNLPWILCWHVDVAIVKMYRLGSVMHWNGCP